MPFFALKNINSNYQLANFGQILIESL